MARNFINDIAKLRRRVDDHAESIAELYRSRDEHRELLQLHDEGITLLKALNRNHAARIAAIGRLVRSPARARKSRHTRSVKP
ncbi:MAG TPA: hypothetical protein VI384_04380 [Candidatus Dormibacteraeota bacterium]